MIAFISVESSDISKHQHKHQHFDYLVSYSRNTPLNISDLLKSENPGKIKDKKTREKYAEK